MLSIILHYWWAMLALAAVIIYGSSRFWAKRRFGSVVEGVLSETQAGFAKGNVNVHSVKAVRTIQVQNESAVLYHIDATIVPSDESVAWCGADLFLRDSHGDPNRVGDVLSLKRWNGTSFEPIKNQADLTGTQRLLLSMRFAGSPGAVRFNFNFANFGPAIQLPQLKASV